MPKFRLARPKYQSTKHPGRRLSNWTTNSCYDHEFVPVIPVAQTTGEILKLVPEFGPLFSLPYG